MYLFVFRVEVTTTLIIAWILAKILVSNNTNTRNILIVFSDLTFVIIFLVVILGIYELIPVQLFKSELMIKNSLGFTNPNIPSYFLFNISFIYLYYKNYNRYYIVGLLLLTIFQYNYNKAYLIAYLILGILYFFRKWINSNLLLYFNIIIYISGIFSVLFSLHIYNFFNVFNIDINQILSNRINILTASTPTFLTILFGSSFRIYIDSIYAIMINYFGLIITLLFSFFYFYKLIRINKNLKINLIFTGVFLFLGLVENIFSVSSLPLILIISFILSKDSYECATYIK